jgi:hypothetical protein
MVVDENDDDLKAETQQGVSRNSFYVVMFDVSVFCLIGIRRRWEDWGLLWPLVILVVEAKLLLKQWLKLMVVDGNNNDLEAETWRRIDGNSF